jgi:hypothetical protein
MIPTYGYGRGDNSGLIACYGYGRSSIIDVIIERVLFLRRVVLGSNLVLRVRKP